MADVYQRLREPIAPGQACGVDLREDAGAIAIYREIKDARSDARSQDRTAESFINEEGGEEGLRQPAARWRDVHDLSLKALGERTKDVEIFAWLMEAAARAKGVVALAEIASAFLQVLQAQFDAIHSIDADEPSERFIPLQGLNGSDGDGTLVRPLRLVSVVPGGQYGRHGLWTHQTAAKNGDAEALGAFEDALSSTAPAEFRQHRDAVSSLLASIRAIDTFLTERVGADAPSFSRLIDILDDIERLQGELTGYVPGAEIESAVEGENAVEASEAGPAPQSGNMPAGAARGPVANREEAFQRLLEVATFFKRTEPHSNIPLALETLVRRGRMDFLTLLVELVPDENQRRDFLIRAGIDPPQG